MSCFVVGLIGGIVVGKSEVSCCFEVLGVIVVDVDLVVCEVVVFGSEGLVCIVVYFGVDILLVDGQFDCVVLCVCIFVFFLVCQVLEVIIYLVICQWLCDICVQVFGFYVIVVILLLVEVGGCQYYLWLDCILVVDVLVVVQYV